MAARLSFLAVAMVVMIAAGGCVFGVYSKQDFGPGVPLGINNGSSLADVIKVMGAPDKVYSVDKTSILVYVQLEGMQVLGVYGNVKKKDVVVIIENGKVTQPPIMVNKGEALTILGFLNAPIMGPTMIKEQ